MAEQKPTATKAKAPAKRPAKQASQTFSPEEKAAMRAAAAEAKKAGTRAEGEADVKAAIAKMAASDKAMATKVHAMVGTAAPHLMPRTWYGMPAWANDEGKVVCFFKDAGKFKDRYATFGFNGAAKLDAGSMWPTSYALTKLTGADEQQLAALVKQAAS